MNRADRGKLWFAILLSTGLNSAQLPDPIKIGSFLTVTGPASTLGDPELKTLQLYVESINAGGGINGRPVELIHYDTGGKAQDAVGFVERLIKNNNVDIHRRRHYLRNAVRGNSRSGKGRHSVGIAGRCRGHCRTGQEMGVQGRPFRPDGRRQDF